MLFVLCCSGHIAERMNLRHFLSLGMLSSGVLTAAFGFGYFFNVHVLWFYILVQVSGMHTLCMLGNFSCFCCRLLTFFKITFPKKSFRNSTRVSNGLDPDQDRHSVGPDLGPNCLPRLSADDKSTLVRTELF